MSVGLDIKHYVWNFSGKVLKLGDNYITLTPDEVVVTKTLPAVIVLEDACIATHPEVLYKTVDAMRLIEARLAELTIPSNLIPILKTKDGVVFDRVLADNQQRIKDMIPPWQYNLKGKTSKCLN